MSIAIINSVELFLSVSTSSWFFNFSIDFSDCGLHNECHKNHFSKTWEKFVWFEWFERSRDMIESERELLQIFCEACDSHEMKTTPKNNTTVLRN